MIKHYAEVQTKILDELKESIQIINANGAYIYVNKSGCEWLGYSPDEFHSLNIKDLLDTFSEKEAWDICFSQLENESSIIKRGNYKHKSGHLIPVESIIKLIDVQGVSLACVLIRDMNDEINTKNFQDVSLKIMHTSVEITEYLLKYDHNRDSIITGLAMLGKSVQVDRVYIFENHSSPETEHMLTSMRYEWVEKGISEQKNNPLLQNFHFKEISPRIFQILSSGNILDTHVKDMEEDEKPGFEEQDIISLLLIPIKIRDKFWGFIGFDSCTCSRIWSMQEISLLRITANTLGLFIDRQESFNTMKNLLEDKETLLSELHHRTKNNLAIITGIIDLHQDTYAHLSIQQYSENIRQRIQNIALIHEILSSTENISHMSIRQYVELLVSKLESTLDYKASITKRFEIDNFKFSNISQMVSVGILLNEILLNSFKHAFKNHKSPVLSIRIKRIDEKVEIFIKDNGSGMNSNAINEIHASSVGFKIIHGLLAQLKAEVNINSDKGMEYKISLNRLKFA